MQKVSFQVIFHAGKDEEDIDSGTYTILSNCEYSKEELQDLFHNANHLLRKNSSVRYNGYLSIDSLIKCAESLVNSPIVPVNRHAQYHIEQWY